ncbi:hypothetical protein EOM81_11150 [bacterium]|nr:hypothetical protein [bacterium]
MKKTCFKCGLEKELDDFYKHPQMADGHLNKCKECTRKDSGITYVKIKNDPERHFKEKSRCMAKSRKSREDGKGCFFPKKTSLNEFRKKYPEKYAAHKKGRSDAIPNGFHGHHWSYCAEHAKDAIAVLPKDHGTIHRYIKYDQERMMYRRLDGVLLDSREESERYYAYVLSLEPNTYPDFAFFDKAASGDGLS